MIELDVDIHFELDGIMAVSRIFEFLIVALLLCERIRQAYD